MAYRLGVDVGGTFTDFLLMNEDSGETHTAKVPSTPEDSSIGVLNGVAVSYTHLTLPTMRLRCRSRWSPYH